jgi:hypothetical protein
VWQLRATHSEEAAEIPILPRAQRTNGTMPNSDLVPAPCAEVTFRSKNTGADLRRHQALPVVRASSAANWVKCIGMFCDLWIQMIPRLGA